MFQILQFRAVFIIFRWFLRFLRIKNRAISNMWLRGAFYRFFFNRLLNNYMGIYQIRTTSAASFNLLLIFIFIDVFYCMIIFGKMIKFWQILFNCYRCFFCTFDLLYYFWWRNSFSDYLSPLFTTDFYLIYFFWLIWFITKPIMQYFGLFFCVYSR